ncbi:hypothetical protein FKW77_005481 [Venturia effusa]|uniref:Secreted protein n=1 Tax=Venturia effusa TaxID=50376 RepID=A0A517L9B5_9PEZI|nr:hypothetical protein FKW77_005481 [Venturia effusa]
MRTTFYHLATLLIAAYVLARSCTHRQSVFHVPCTADRVCSGGDSDVDNSTKAALVKSGKAWLDWAKEIGNVPICGAYCSEPKAWTPDDGIGSAWAVVCEAPRAKNKPSTGLPAAEPGLDRYDNTKCNVYCSLAKKRNCEMIFSVC